MEQNPLTYKKRTVIILWHINVPVAQPDRVFGYEPKGRGFESLQARHKKAPFLGLFVLLIIKDFHPLMPPKKAHCPLAMRFLC